jgi:hypothetical protein
VREYTSVCDCRADQGVELFVATDGQLEVTGSDTLDFEVLGGVLGRVNVRYLRKWVG